MNNRGKEEVAFEVIAALIVWSIAVLAIVTVVQVYAGMLARVF